MLRLLPTGRFFVIGGSSKDHKRARVVVDLGTDAAKALQITVRTYFYANNTASVSKVSPMVPCVLR